jgi:hypothetical protein
LFHCCPKLSMNFSDPTMEYKKKISQIGPVELSKLQDDSPLVSDAKILIGFMASPARPHFPLKSNDFHAENPRPQPIQKMRSFSKLPPEWDAPRRGDRRQPRVAIVVEGGAPRAQQYKKKVKVSPWSREIDGRQRARPIPHETAA